MKYIFLIVKRLQQYYQKNKAIFLLFVIGGIFNAVMLCYFYGNLLPNIANRESEDVNYRKYSVDFKEESYGDFSAFTALSDNTLIEAASASGTCIYKDSSIKFRTYTGDYPVVLLSGRKVFTGRLQVVVPYTCLSSIGSHILLGDISFEIIGKSTEYDYYIIPLDDFTELGVSNGITGMTFIATERQNLQNDQVLQLIWDSFSNCSKIQSELETYLRADQDNTEYYAGQIIACYIVVTIAYMFLLYYLINSIMQESIVSMFVGASKADLTALVFWETAILSLSVGGIGLLLHKLLYTSLFAKLNVVSDLKYYPGDYLLLYFFIFIISLAVSLPLAARYLRMSPVTAKREYA